MKQPPVPTTATLEGATGEDNMSFIAPLCLKNNMDSTIFHNPRNNVLEEVNRDPHTTL
jgi:hypothetical protein